MGHKKGDGHWCWVCSEARRENERERLLQVTISSPNSAMAVLSLRAWLAEAGEKLACQGKAWLGPSVIIKGRNATLSLLCPKLQETFVLLLCSCPIGQRFLPRFLWPSKMILKRRKELHAREIQLPWVAGRSRLCGYPLMMCHKPNCLSMHPWERLCQEDGVRSFQHFPELLQMPPCMHSRRVLCKTCYTSWLACADDLLRLLSHTMLAATAASAEAGTEVQAAVVAVLQGLSSPFWYASPSITAGNGQSVQSKNDLSGAH